MKSNFLISSSFDKSIIKKDNFVFYYPDLFGSAISTINSRNMISITKIFRFEAAHAIFGYQGKCGAVHGHSYELHVTVRSEANAYLESPGFIIDFKDLKTIVMETIINKMDHHLMLSGSYIKHHGEKNADNVMAFEVEPSAENLLLYISKELTAALPSNIRLSALKLFETRDSYAEWKNEYTHHRWPGSL
jgi:6-pyruvoyltetrahydropterin/6-carboxytetrahydropterin synthase